MSCQLTINYSTNYGDSGTATFDVPDGSYQDAYPYFYPGSPKKYDVRTDGSQGTIVLAGPYYPPEDFTVTYSSFSSTCAPVNTQYDCINGACIKASKYGSPGLYSSLAACEVACGTSACGGQCIGSSDWAQIEGLITQLKNRSCG